MRHLIAVLLVVVYGFSLTATAQIDPEHENLSWRQLLRIGDDLMSSGSFYNAIEYYKAAFNDRPEMGEIAMKVGHAYQAGRNYKGAEEYFRIAFDIDNDRFREAQYYYADMLKINGRYEESIENFRDFQRRFRARGRDQIELRRGVRDKIQSVEFAMEARKDPLNVEIYHLNGGVNDIYTEFSPILAGDSMLIFASLIVDSVPVLEGRRAAIPRARLFQATKQGDNWGNSWGNVQELEGPFNDRNAHTGNGTFSTDGSRFYFTRCTDERGANVICNIYMSVRNESGRWSNPRSLSINDRRATDTHPTVGVFRDQEILYFSSNRDGGQGGMDIWFSLIFNDGEEHREPRNLGRRINTPNDEITPFYDSNEEILYFSSNGHPGIGGFDVFMSKGNANRWAAPVNVGYPINSSYDDMYYFHDESGNRGVFVSNRDEALSPKWPNCCDDIFAFEYILPPVFTIVPILIDNKTNERLDDANVQLFLAHNDESRGDELIDSLVFSTREQRDFYVGTLFENFRIEGRKYGYIRGVNTTSTVGLEESDTLEVLVYLTPVEDLVITLRNVYFDFDEYFIREDAKPSLDSAFILLEENPNIQIELSAHTDSRGSAAYNETLSQNRANSARTYLIEQGIDPERIVAKGYGFNRLLNNCRPGVFCPEEDHDLNRRVELRVIGEIEGAIVRYDESEIEEMRRRRQEREASGQSRDIDWGEIGEDE